MYSISAFSPLVQERIARLMAAGAPKPECEDMKVVYPGGAGYFKARVTFAKPGCDTITTDAGLLLFFPALTYMDLVRAGQIANPMSYNEAVAKLS